MNTKMSIATVVLFVVLWFVAIVGMISLNGCGHTIDGAGSMLQGVGNTVSGIGSDMREAQAGQSGRGYVVKE